MQRKVVITSVILAFAINVMAQQQLSQKMHEVFDACWAMRTAISTGNTASLKSANEAFKKCNIHPFLSLRPQDSDTISLNGHFVWDEIFVDSLIANRDVRKFAQRYAEKRRERGARGPRREAIYIASYAVKGKGKARFSFTSEKHQEIAVIAEPQANITLRVYCKKTNKWHNDDQDVKRGRESRFQIFDLPNGIKDTVELEVINCEKEDCSFVVISN